MCCIYFPAWGHPHGTIWWNSYLEHWISLQEHQARLPVETKAGALAWTAIPHNHHWLQAFASLFSDDFPIYQWSNFSTWRAFPKLICDASIWLFQLVKEWSGWLVIFNHIWRKNISRQDFDSAYFDPASSIFYWLTPFNSPFVLQNTCFVSQLYFLLVVKLNLFFGKHVSYIPMSYIYVYCIIHYVFNISYIRRHIYIYIYIYILYYIIVYIYIYANIYISLLRWRLAANL